MDIQLIDQHRKLSNILKEIRDLYKSYNGYKLENELVENLMVTIELYEEEIKLLKK